jgi:hypothetical protein
VSNIYSDGKYLGNNPTWDVEHSIWKANEIYKLLAKNNVYLKKIVEIGCGAGGILDQLSKIYPEARLVGFDISPQAIRLSQGFSSDRVKFVTGDFLNYPNENFDLTICADVFEHVDDYMGFLRKLSQRNTLTVFHIPLDFSLVSSVMPQLLIKTRQLVGHLHYFNKLTAEATLTGCGFKIIESRITAGCLKFPDPGILGRLFWFIRKSVFYFSPTLAAQLLGGFSLLVLASCDTDV